MKSLPTYLRLSEKQYEVYLLRKEKSRAMHKLIKNLSHVKFKGVDIETSYDFIDMWKNYNRTSYVWLIAGEDYNPFKSNHKYVSEMIGRGY